MRRVFITSNRLKKYREVIVSFATFIGKRCKYYNNNENSLQGYLTNFIVEYNKIDFSKFNNAWFPDYKSHLLSYLISNAYTLKEYDLNTLIYDLINVIAKNENISIIYVDHLFKKDSLLEYGFDEIRYKEYIKYLKEKYKYSDEEINEITIVANK